MLLASRSRPRFKNLRPPNVSETFFIKFGEELRESDPSRDLEVDLWFKSDLDDFSVFDDFSDFEDFDDLDDFEDFVDFESLPLPLPLLPCTGLLVTQNFAANVISIRKASFREIYKKRKGLVVNSIKVGVTNMTKKILKVQKVSQ